jgi:hypothetical protein
VGEISRLGAYLLIERMGESSRVDAINTFRVPKPGFSAGRSLIRLAWR